MSVDATLLDIVGTPYEATIERGRIRQFANAIGEHDPVHHDVAAARAAGHPDLVAPLTFLFGLELEQSDVFDVLAGYGVQISQILHGEQRFRCYAMVHAGDEVTFTSSYQDVYSKAGGKLDFVVRRTDVRRGDELVAQLESTTVIKNGASA
ncbi:MaoC family dehydratase N-terminal domain-containing protein (plasmid) [Rhodococcus sp. USK10]|uniref:MaoC family dehydratase N-terminal domain-containing protein n=1 Tax=Rhodococcus sp. USK10 TaxID=2789739 RepID=UPI001C601043|nr:MaoC family dehydratase N-terminal domain-containing protein [Rhodococcus sp. USK10]QYB00277.1 MaoC family dehydratase N-terminal domain-containing protein [Rhodococcus sp. USK10]